MIGGGAGELLRLSVGRLPRPERLAALRLRRLRSLVRHAYDNVPYYRSLMDGAGLTPEDIRSVEDLRRIPVSTREELREAGDGIFARGVDPEGCVVSRTSGSTGRPWSVYRSHGDDLRRRALELRSMRCAGVRPTDRMATLGPGYIPKRRPMERIGLYRTDYLSPLLPVDEQIARLREIRPTVLWIYPSLLRVLLEQAGSLSAIAQPRLLITSAEALDESLRRRVCGEYGLATRNFYGSTETGRIAWECAAGEGLHVNTDCLVLDLEEEEAPGLGHPVVVTNLLSHAMPLLRYRLGDRCAMAAGPCSCGMTLPLMHPPLGRGWDVLLLPSGRVMAPWAISAAVNRVPGVRRYRVIQQRVDRLLVRLDCAQPLPRSALDELRGRIAGHLAEPVAIRIELVDRIDPVGGKDLVYISELAEDRRGSG